MGSSPRNGKALLLALLLLRSSPPMTRLWPSCSCTVVETRRVVKAGSSVLPSPVPAPTDSREISDTSGATFRLMRPPSSTVGTNFRPTPNSRSCKVTALPAAPDDCVIGMKTLPPTRKLPSWPLMATMVGSASIFTRPSLFSASRLMLLPLRNSKPALALPPPRKLDNTFQRTSPPPAACTFSPSLSSRDLDTSAIRTSSITCWASRTRSKLMMREGPAVTLPERRK